MPPSEPASQQPEPAIEKAKLRKQAARNRSLLMTEHPSAGDDLTGHREVVLGGSGRRVDAEDLPPR